MDMGAVGDVVQSKDKFEEMETEGDSAGIGYSDNGSKKTGRCHRFL